MKKTEKAKFFDVSLTTLGNWKRQGCPVDGDVAGVATWKAERDLQLAGIPPEISKLPAFIGEHARRRADLDERIEMVNAWPPGTDKKPNLLKVAVVSGLILERALLSLPDKLMKAGPAATPESFFSVVFDALDEARAEVDPA